MNESANDALTGGFSMGFNCGIVGLPNVGKSTLFNAITSAGAQVANYPFTTIDPNTGIATVPDKRLEAIADIIKPEKVVPTTIEFVDIAGLVKDASRGEGLGNQFLAHIREVDAIAHVVRCFENKDVVHIYETIDPKRDIEIVEAELILRDLDTVERRIHEIERRAKSGDKKLKEETEIYYRLRQHLAEGRLARYFEHGHIVHIDVVPAVVMRELHLLTDKPVMYVANVDEAGVIQGNPYVAVAQEVARKENARVAIICGKIEAEIAELPIEEREVFLKELGLTESGLDKVIREGYSTLDLITFFTFFGHKEVHAWTVKRGATAPEAAGRVHTDFQKGFIRAEVIKYEDLVRFKSEHDLRERGLVQIHGHDYIVQDGDIIHFKFSVAGHQ
jgi:GTP-binding protein YchF